MATIGTDWTWVGSASQGSYYGVSYYQIIYAKYSRTDYQKQNNKSTLYIKVSAYKDSTSTGYQGYWVGTFRGILTNSWSVNANLSSGIQSVDLWSTSFEVEHDSNGDYSTWIGATGVDAPVPTSVATTIADTTITLPQIPRYAQAYLSNTSYTKTSITYKWSASASADRLYYSLDGGSTYSSAITISGTSGTQTITGLTAGTTYNLKIKVRRADSGLVSDTYASTTIAVTTAYNPYIATPYDVTIEGRVKQVLYNWDNDDCTLTFYNAEDDSELMSYTTNKNGLVAFTPTDVQATALYNAFDDDEGSFYIVVTTSSSTSTHSATKKLLIDDTLCTPIIASTSGVSEVNSNVRSLTSGSKLIKGFSTGRITYNTSKISSTLDTNATITARYLDDTAISSAHNYCDIANISGTSYKLNVKNNRGLTSADYTITPTYLDYFSPTIAQTSYIKRPSPTSNKMYVSFSGTFFNDYFDEDETNLNDVKIECYVREDEEDDWTHCFSTSAVSTGTTSFVKNTDYEVDENSYETTSTTIELYNPLSGAVQGKWEYQKIYYFKLEIGDALYTATSKTKIIYPQQVEVGQSYFDWWRSNGINYFNVNGEYYQNGNPLLDLIHPVGEIFLTTDTSFDPNTSWGGTWVQLTSDTYLKIVTSNAGSIGGTSSDHKIPISSMPSHNHSIYGNPYGSATWVSGVQRMKYDVSTTTASDTYTLSAPILNTGGGQAYYPYYYGTIAWHRTA